MGLSPTVSEINAIAIEKRKLFYPVFNAPLKVLSFDFCDGI